MKTIRFIFNYLKFRVWFTIRKHLIWKTWIALCVIRTNSRNYISFINFKFDCMFIVYRICIHGILIENWDKMETTRWLLTIEYGCCDWVVIRRGTRIQITKFFQVVDWKITGNYGLRPDWAVVFHSESIGIKLNVFSHGIIQIFTIHVIWLSQYVTKWKQKWKDNVFVSI